MDFNDINARIKRIYNAIDKQYEYDIQSHTNVFTEYHGLQGKTSVSFGHYDKSELINRVFGVISAIAGLKDHIKNKLKNMGKDPNDVERLINSSLHLQLIMDLWNQDKHGYPLGKYARSNKNPKLKNIQQGLTMKGGKSGSIIFEFNGSGGAVKATENLIIKINGDIVDDNEKLIMRLDEMINGAMDNFEKFIRDNNLS